MVSMRAPSIDKPTRSTTYLMLTRISSGPGFGVSISLYSMGPPVFSMTQAICFFGTSPILTDLRLDRLELVVCGVSINFKLEMPVSNALER